MKIENKKLPKATVESTLRWATPRLYDLLEKGVDDFETAFDVVSQEVSNNPAKTRLGGASYETLSLSKGLLRVDWERWCGSF